MPDPIMPETRRRSVVVMVMVLFWLLIFEGAIRKWVAPQFSAYLYFIRDPFVLVTYVLAWRAGAFASIPALLQAAFALAALALVLGAVHLASGNSQYTLILAAYGFRNYFLYVPLAFVVANCFRMRDLSTLAAFTIVAMLIATPIAVLQFEAAPDSILNVGRSSDPDLQFQNLASGSGKVRPAGTFTSVMGMTQLTVCTVALLLWAWSSNSRPKPVNPWLIRLGLCAVAVSLAVSGSRTSFVHSALVALAAMVLAPLLPGVGTKFRTFLLPGIAAAAFVVLFPLLLPEAAQTFSDRWKDAAQTEGAHFQLGWIGRAFYGFYDFFRLLGEMPLLGHGIGTAGNGAVNMGVRFNGVSVLKLAEEDWSRHVIELGPVLALLFIAFRFSFGIWLGWRALRATLRSGELLPVTLFVYCGVALIHGQITGHGLVNGFGWLYVGACMAACTAVLEKSPAVEATTTAASLAAVPLPFPNLMR